MATNTSRRWISVFEFICIVLSLNTLVLFKFSRRSPITRSACRELTASPEHTTPTPMVIYTDEELSVFFVDLHAYNNVTFPFDNILDNIPYMDFLKSKWKTTKRKGIELPGYQDIIPRTNWERFHKGINKNYLYDPDEDFLDDLLKDLATVPIIKVQSFGGGGTSLKLNFTFHNGENALVKVQRFPRDQEDSPNQFFYRQYERYNAEIAAFHLDRRLYVVKCAHMNDVRVLGFFRTPPTVGRRVNITSELKMNAVPNLLKTFYTSPAGNRCFYGHCTKFCDLENGVCGNPDILAVAVSAFLPKLQKLAEIQYPWKQSYSPWGKPSWEKNDDFCETVRVKDLHNKTRRLLDITDSAIFNFLTGNMDRHSLYSFEAFGNDTFVLHDDSGRGFGKINQDSMSILAPVRQCCLIRHSTFVKLVKLYRGPDKLSSLMMQSMSKDMLRPFLADSFVNALDRRLMKILQVVMMCVKTQNLPYEKVIVDDGF